MKIDLYRIFFPVGWLLGFWGALVWVLYFFDLIQYPGALHPEIMMGGFILSFVIGFLGTAAPKFTNSFPPTERDIQIAFVLGILLFVGQLFSNEIYFRLCSLGVFIFLIYFLMKRFQKRTANPPNPFLFVGVGVLTGTLGSIILILSRFDLVNEKIYLLGRLFFYQAYILSFVLGIGSRLIPSLLGHAPPPNMPQQSIGLKAYAVMATLFMCTYIIEVYFSHFVGVHLRNLLVLFIALVSWKIHLLPKRKAIQAYGLWLSCLFMVLGLVGSSFSEVYYIHFIHLFYIAGLSLLTLMIAARVILSHGGHDVRLEVKSKSLMVVMVLLILAALTRLSAGFMPELYHSHLLYAASVWILGMSVWGIVFLPKIFKIHLNN
ncbi:MAG: NnrS family protein [Bacteriovorax sp.]|nr:NnrS family protein [Bacteriovorax sp.]